MNKIKKILKSFLAASLFVVGLVCNPLNINAQERAGVVQYTYLTGTINGTDIGGTVTVRLRMSVTNDGVTVTMGYPASGSSCSSSRTMTSCTFTDISHSGTSYVGSNSQLKVRFKITLRTNTTTENRTYEAYISGNVLRSIEQK